MSEIEATVGVADESPLPDLTEQRVIDIAAAGRHYRLTFKTITQEEWKKYFAGIVSTAQREGKSVVTSFDSDAAATELVERNLIAAEGYALAGVKTPMEIKGWQTLIPVGHKIAAGKALRIVAVAPDDEQISLGLQTVTLKATWSAGAGDDVLMLEYTLRHHFRPPSVDQQRRVRLAQSRSVITGNGRTGTTKYLGAQAELMDIYDELIDSVEGYSDLGMADAALAARMDAYHKVTAAAALFAAPSIGAEDDE